MVSYRLIVSGGVRRLRCVRAGLFLVLEVFHEHFRGLESGDFVFGDDDGGVLGDVSGCLLRAGLDDEAAEAAQENRFAVGEGVLDHFHELFDCFENCGTFDAGCL